RVVRDAGRKLDRRHDLQRASLCHLDAPLQLLRRGVQSCQHLDTGGRHDVVAIHRGGHCPPDLHGERADFYQGDHSRAVLMKKNPFPVPVRVQYSCAKCPAFCCTYTDIEVTQRDLARIARHFEISLKAAKDKYTKMESTGKVRVMRHRSDKHFITACMM